MRDANGVLLAALCLRRQLCPHAAAFRSQRN